MKTKTLLVSLLILLAVPFSVLASSPLLNGNWKKKNSFGDQYKTLRLNLNNPDKLGNFSIYEMDGLYVNFDKILSRSENAVRLEEDRGYTRYTADIRYTPADQTVSITITESGNRTPIEKETFRENEHLTTIISIDKQNILSADNVNVKIGVAEKGEPFPWAGESYYSGSYAGEVILLPDGRKGLISGTPSPKEVFDSSVFSKSWETSANDMGNDNLEMELFKDGIVRAVNTHMYPPTPSGGIRPALVESYLGVIKGNRIILTHTGGMAGAYSTTFEEFSPMEKPLSIIYIHDEEILFDGNEYSFSRY